MHPDRAGPSDPRLAPLLHLRDAELRRSIEAEQGLFVVEGVLAIRRALQSTYRLRTVVLLPERVDELADDLAGRDVEIVVTSREVLAAVTGFDAHRGALAVAERRPSPALGALAASARLIVGLEGVNDHENLGAIGRTASALGVDALVLDPTCADPLYRRSVRVSMGELLHVPWTRCPDWTAGLDQLRCAGFELVALTPAADAEPIGDVAGTSAPRRALLAGAEGAGLAATTLAAADRRVRIPLRAGVDSLNVGHALAIALHVLGSVAAAPDRAGWADGAR